MNALTNHYDNIIPPIHNEKENLVKEMVEAGGEEGESAHQWSAKCLLKFYLRVYFI